MPDPDSHKPFIPNVSEVLARTAEQTDLDALRQRGYSKVKVLDERRLQELIGRAVEAALQAGSKPYLEDERQRIEEEARHEFQELLEKHQKMAKTQERFEALTKRVQERLAGLQSGAEPARAASESQFMRSVKAQKEGLAKVEDDMQDLLDRFEQSEKLRVAMEEKHGLLVKEYARLSKKLSETELKAAEAALKADAASPEQIEEARAAMATVQREKEQLAAALGQARTETRRLLEDLEKAREASEPPPSYIPPAEGLRIVVED